MKAAATKSGGTTREAGAIRSRREALQGLGVAAAAALLGAAGGEIRARAAARAAAPAAGPPFPLEVDLRDAPLGAALYAVLFAAGLSPERFAVTRHAFGDVSLATLPREPEPAAAIVDRMLESALPPAEGLALRRRADAAGVWRIEVVRSSDGAAVPDGTKGLREWESPDRRTLLRIRGGGRLCAVVSAGGRASTALLEFQGPVGWLPIVVRRSRALFVPPLRPGVEVSLPGSSVRRLARQEAELLDGNGDVFIAPLQSVKQANDDLTASLKAGGR